MSGPGVVLLSRVADGPAAVPSDQLECSMCKQACWISRESGPGTIATARHLGGGQAPAVVCTRCLATAMQTPACVHYGPLIR